MNIDMKGTQIDLTPALKEYAEKKIGSLEKHLARWDEEGDVEVRIEVGRLTRHHHKGGVFRAEVNIDIPGGVLRAEAVAEDIHAAIDFVRDKLKAEIAKRKDASLR